VSDGPFLESAAALLAEPDPGPTPYVVEGLIVEKAIAAVQGPPKVGKTWTVLEIATSIATGLPAFGQFATLHGPVVIILEESGRAALHRRLDALTRGRAINPSKLADLHFAANRRVRLNDPAWRERIRVDAGKLKPRLVIFDPLVRLKGASVSENDQGEMAAVLDYPRDLRDELETAVLFVHHTGHGGTHLRGTSDLEGYWESKLSLTGQADGTTEITAEHREAEATDPFQFRQAWDQHGSLRLKLTEDSRTQQLREAITTHVKKHPGDHAENIAKAIRKRAADVRAQLSELENAGTLYRSPSEYRDAAGRAKTRTAWFPGPQATEQLSVSAPNPRTLNGQPNPDREPASQRPAFNKGGRGTATDRSAPDGLDGWTIEDLEAIAAEHEEALR
jgi:AAA domain